MTKLDIKKHEYKVIILGILKNIEAKQNIYDLYEINVFKTNILEHIQKDLPIVNNNVEDKKYDKDLLSNEAVKLVVSYCKYLPIKEEDIIKYLRNIFIQSYNLNALIGITNIKDIKTLLDISVLTKKQKMFEYLIKMLDIDFIQGKINNESYKNAGISKYDILYYLNDCMNMLIYKFFKYFLSANPDNNKINSVLEKIKIFPQLHEILYLISKANEKTINLSSLIGDIKEIDSNDIINFEVNNSDLDMKKYLKLISITNKISLINYLLEFHKISIKFNFSDKIGQNDKIMNILIKNYAKILDIYKYIEEDNEKNNKGDEFSCINTTIADENIKIPIIMRNKLNDDKWDYNNNFGKFIKKLFYIQENNKTIDNSLNKKNNIIFNHKFINYLKIFNSNFINHLFDYLEEHKQEEKYIRPKYLYLLDEESLLDIFDNKSSLEQIIKDINEFYYLGEYPTNSEELDDYLAQGKIILEHFYNKSVLEKIINRVISVEHKKFNKYNDLVNYVLFTNLIGGSLIKVDYNVMLYKYQDVFKDIKNAEDILFNKNFSYFNVFKLLMDNYNPNVNQLLSIIWIRKLHNIFYTILFDDKKENSNKLYIDKNKVDINLNVYEIRQYISKEKKMNFNTNNFIDKYLSILSQFIKNIKVNKENNQDIISQIKIYFSEIYFSLETLLSSVSEEKIKTKIKFALDEMKSVKYLICDNNNEFKEVIIINEDNNSKNVEFINIKDIKISLISGYEEEEDYNEDSEDDYDDYGRIEENIKDQKKRKW